MKKSMFASTILALGLLSQSGAYAATGGENGNGGDAVVCRRNDGSILSVELLDFYESRIQGVNQIPISAGWSYQQIVEQVLNQLEKVAPMRAALYRGLTNEYMAQINLQAGIKLVDVPDSGNLYFPEGCAVEQLADMVTGQLKPINYLVKKELWDRMDALNQAGLVFHESIYRDEKFNGRQRSIRPDTTYIRAFNGYLFSAQLESDNFQKRWLLFATLNISPIEYGGVPFEISSVRWDKNMNVSGWIFHFFDDNAYQAKPYGVNLACSAGSVEFYRGSTDVFQIGLCENQNFSINGKNVEIKGSKEFSTPITFFPGGALRTGTLAENTKLQFEDGTWREVVKDTLITIDQSGLIVGMKL